jgi:hypothetical protein
MQQDGLLRGLFYYLMNVPMEIVLELLGYSKISATQVSYAKIVNNKVSAKMDIF